MLCAAEFIIIGAYIKINKCLKNNKNNFVFALTFPGVAYQPYRPGAQDVYSCEKGQKVWPRGLIWVAVNIPKMFCWQAWGGAFNPKSPFEVSKKLHLFMLKGPREKTLPSCSLGFQEYEMDNASNFTRGFTPASNPKRGNEMGFYLC